MKWIKKLCAVVSALAFAVGVWCISPIVAKADDTMDVTQNVSASRWISQNELKVTYLSLGDGVVPSIGYGIIDNNAYTYVQDYVAVNGRTIKEINTDTTLGASSWTYTVFPSTADVKYKLPIIVYVNNGKLEIKIHNNYVERMGDYVEITAKAGLYFENGGTRYEVSEDKSFTVFGEKMKETDITEKVSISEWLSTGNSAELTLTMIRFPAGVLPDTLSYQVMDTSTWAYVQEYITINGKSVKEINTQTDTSGYIFATFPSTAKEIYKVPVIVFENGNTLEIKIHNNYLQTIKGDIEISLKAGFSIVSGDVTYVVTEDRLFTVKGSTETDVTADISIEGWWATGDARELTYTVITFPKGVLPGIIGYGAIDNSAWRYIQEYIFLNGKSVKEINTQTETSDYTFSTFPSTAADKYRLPVIIFENGNTLEVKFHNAYLQTIGDKVEITLKAGFSILDGDTKYVVSEDVTQTVLQITETELTGISVSGWATAGDAMELTYTRIRFPEGVLPESIDYDVLDKPAWTYLQEYIYLNGKSIKQINEETDTSGYVFSTFPSTADKKYELPVIIFENGNALELKFHNTYLQSVEGDLEITIAAGLYILVGATRYVVEKDICYQLSGDIWSDKNRTYTVTYYVNGQVYGAIEEYTYKTALVVRESVATEAGYAFSGWEYTATDGIIQDMEIRGYITPIRYTITYYVNGGVNASTNPITYYVTDGEIFLKDATKEGAIFKGWYTSKDYTQKVEKLSPDSLGDMELYALFEGGAKDEGGCASSLSIGYGLLALVGAVVLFKRKDGEV